MRSSKEGETKSVKERVKKWSGDEDYNRGGWVLWSVLKLKLPRNRRHTLNDGELVTAGIWVGEPDPLVRHKVDGAVRCRVRGHQPLADQFLHRGMSHAWIESTGATEKTTAQMSVC